jgi:hypothetical protein
MSNDGYTSATTRGEQRAVFSLASSSVLERRLDSECLASPAVPTVSETELLARGKVQVVRRPPKDGRPVQTVTRGPTAEKARSQQHEACSATRFLQCGSERKLYSCKRA